MTATYEGRPLPDPDHPVTDQGLGFDLVTMVTRRRALRLLGGAGGAALLAACTPGAPSQRVVAAPTDLEPGVCLDEIAPETPGPFPGDGSRGPNLLAEPDVVRRDLTTSFGGMSGAVEGVPLEVELVLQDLTGDCTAFAGAAVYAWHCDAAGRYSLYTSGVTDQNWLRGVQAADGEGVVRFTTVYPGCYPGRWPHIHFEVFEDLAAAGDVANVLATSQLALPRDASEAVYATDGVYEGSTGYLAQLSLAGDIVFRDDGGVQQIGSTTGSVEEGLTVRLAVAVDR